MKTLVLTLDLDAPEDYARLHDLKGALPKADVMYGAPLERFVGLCAGAVGTGTIFAIGRDMRGANAQRLRHLADSGFEIASHSFAHDYRLQQADEPTVRNDLTRAHEAIAQTIGIAPRGFRAPGYHLNRAMLDTLEALKVSYDSSVMPSPPYYAAKALVLAAYRLFGRKSGAHLGTPALALAPRRPYRLGLEPYAPGSRSLWELPISVGSSLRLPLTGASWLLLPKLLRSRMLAELSKEDFVLLNLHGLDLADVEHEALPESFAARQPELRVPISKRLSVLGEVVAELARGRTITTAAISAKQLSRTS